MARVKSNGIELEWDSFGDKSKPTILLVMGLGMQMTHWPDPFCQALADRGFHVVRFDNRDIGLSTHFDHLEVPDTRKFMVKKIFGLSNEPPYRLTDMAADTAGLIDALELGPVHMVGVSMGGMISQLVTALHRDKVHSLTAIMSSGGNKIFPLPDWDAMKLVNRRFKANPSREEAIDMAVGLFQVIGSKGFEQDWDEVRARATRNYDRSFHPAGRVRQMAAILSSPPRAPLLRTIDRPTLVIHGEQDPLVPVAHGIDLASHIPNAKLDVIPGMGHDLAMGLRPVIIEKITNHVNAAEALGRKRVA